MKKFFVVLLLPLLSVYAFKEDLTQLTRKQALTSHTFM